MLNSAAGAGKFFKYIYGSVNKFCIIYNLYILYMKERGYYGLQFWTDQGSERTISA